LGTREREQKRRQLELEEILREVSIVVSSSLELREVFRRISEQMARVLPFDTASLQLLDNEKSILKIVAATGFDNNNTVEKLEFPLDNTFPNAQVLRSKDSLIFSDVQKSFPHFADPNYHATKVRSWLGVPLLKGYEAIGVI